MKYSKLNAIWLKVGFFYIACGAIVAPSGTGFCFTQNHVIEVNAPNRIYGDGLGLWVRHNRQVGFYLGENAAPASCSGREGRKPRQNDVFVGVKVFVAEQAQGHEIVYGSGGERLSIDQVMRLQRASGFAALALATNLFV